MSLLSPVPPRAWVAPQRASLQSEVPTIFEPEVAARAIVRAAYHRRREVMVGGSTVKAILGNKVFRDGWTDTWRTSGTTDNRPKSQGDRIGRITSGIRSRRITALTDASIHDRDGGAFSGWPIHIESSWAPLELPLVWRFSLDKKNAGQSPRLQGGLNERT